MKRLLLLTSLILFHFLASAQPNIHKTTWVGENREHLNISKKTACLQKGRNFIQFDVVKYVKGKYIIFSNTVNGLELKTKYNIAHINQDTLILMPEGNDFFELTEPDQQNRYVFVNSLRTYKFVKLHFEISSNFENTRRYYFDIDSAKRLKVTKKDEYFNETKIYRSPVTKKDYERLLKILSRCDIDYYPDENVWDDKGRNSILEIWYNDKRKIFKGGIPAFYSKLGDFMWEYMMLRTNFSNAMRIRRK
jgi:hypothetical protein